MDKRIWWVIAAIAGAAVLVAGGLAYVVTMGGEESPTEAVGTPLNNPTAASGKQTYHLDVDGARREFIVYRPENVSASEALPVVFMFHGGNETAESKYRESGWVEEARKQGLLVVFPQALKYHVTVQEDVAGREEFVGEGKFETRWTNVDFASTLDPAYPDQVTYDDVAFVRAMVDFLKTQYAVDATRFYATGFSNGGSFTSRLIVDASDLFAAFAPSSPGGVEISAVQGMADDKPVDFTPRPVILMLGSTDPKLTPASEVEKFSTDASAADLGNPVYIRFIKPYLDIAELSDAHTFQSEGRSSRFTYTEPITKSSVDRQFQLLMIDGMDHIYPNGKNNRLVAADVYWSFFQSYAL